ncbi:hypothetical protein EXS70_00430 [Candidatus Peribacteria bacterium]|nr:hypothetical protein [Candidatus Peribacteria bacterium]
MPPTPNIHRDEHEKESENADGNRTPVSETPEGQILLEKMESVAHGIAHDGSLMASDMEKVRGALHGLIVDVGPAQISLSTLPHVPDLENNKKVWEQIASGEDMYGIYQLTYLPTNIAKIIAKKNTDSCNLPMLKSLSVDAAKEFRNIDRVDLYSLEELSDDLAEEFAQHTGSSLSLGVKTLTQKQAALLKRHAGGLMFYNLENPPDDVLEELAQLKYFLSLNISSLNSTRAAKALGEHQEDLVIFGVEHMSLEAARELSKHAGGLHVGTWKDMPTEILQELVKTQGRLVLGYESLTIEQAEIIATHSDGVSLQGLRELHADIASALAKMPGKLEMSNLRLTREKDDEVLRILAEREVDSPYYGVIDQTELHSDSEYTYMSYTDAARDEAAREKHRRVMEQYGLPPPDFSS